MTDSTATAELAPHSETPALARYRRMAWITLAAVYFLILVGASVRASGAGMGCPDWPTCFGSWIPPTSESQLPANYRELYAVGGAEAQFNVVKTWTEYLNRLTGVTIGLLIFLTAIYSWLVRRHDKAIMIASIAAFFMVGFQGWLGAKVVSSNLQAGMITIHMLMALAIVATLLFALARARRGIVMAESIAGIDPHFERWLYMALGLAVLQIAMGTQVREMIDFLNHVQGANRSTWAASLPRFSVIHQGFSVVVLFSNLWLGYLLVRSLGWKHTLTRFTVAMVGVVILTAFSGFALGYLGMSAFVQPMHLVCASLLFGLQFLIWMSYRHAKDAETIGMTVSA